MIRNSKAGYDYLFNNNRLLFSRTIDYCFPIVLEIFVIYNSETGYRNANSFLNRLWRFLKNWHLSVKLHLSAPRYYAINHVYLYQMINSKLASFKANENSSCPIYIFIRMENACMCTVVSSRLTASKLNSASLTCAQQQRHLVGTKTRKLSSCDT